MKNDKTLILSRKEIEKIITMPKTIAAIESALKRDFLMPPKVYLEMPKYKGDFRAMPCFLDPYADVKWVNVHPENPQKFGLPTVMALIILNDARNALPLAVMDGMLITNYRTGAIGGIASKYLARRDSKVLGLVGAGQQARTQLLAISSVFKLKEAKVCCVDAHLSQKFVKEMQPKVKCALSIAKDAEETCDADIVCTTTPSRQPVVKNGWIKPGTHINAIGADAAGKQELEEAILLRAKIVVDEIHQALHGGEMNVGVSKGILSEANIAANIADVVKGKAVRGSAEDVTVFTSTGLALQDIATAAYIFEEAKKKKIGKAVRII